MENQNSSATIVIDLFSGRPNPAVEIHGPEVERLRQALSRLDNPAVAAQPNGLGFRGFVVSFDGGETVYRIYHGTITDKDGRTFSDDGGRVQSQILSLLPPELRGLVSPDGNAN